MTHEVLIKARSGEFKIVETEGDVFEAPQNAVLIREYTFSSQCLLVNYYACTALWGIVLL